MIVTVEGNDKGNQTTVKQVLSQKRSHEELAMSKNGIFEKKLVGYDQKDV